MKLYLKSILLSIFLTAAFAADADVYIIGSDVNGKYWECGAEDAKMTEQVPGVLYYWEGETLGAEFKFNGGDWSDGNFAGTSIPSNVGTKDSNIHLKLGMKYDVYASSGSGNIQLLPTVARVKNPRVTLDLARLTVLVEGEAEEVPEYEPLNPHDYSLYSLWIEHHDYASNTTTEDLYPTELVSASDNSYIVRNVNLRGEGSFELQTKNKEHWFGYAIVKMDVVNEKNPETPLYLYKHVEFDPFNPQINRMTSRNFDFTGIYDVEITYSGDEALVRFVKQEEVVDPNEVDVLNVNMIVDYGDNQVKSYVDEVIDDHTALYRNVKLSGNGSLYLLDRETGLRFGAQSANANSITLSNLSTVLSAKSQENVPVEGLEGYYNVKVVYNDTYTSATVTFSNKLAPEYGEYTGDLYIAGEGNGWKLADPAYKMTCTSPGVYEWTGKKLATNFKINGGDWDAKIPGTDARLVFGGEWEDYLYPGVPYQVLIRAYNINFAGDLSAVHNVKVTLNLKNMSLTVDADEHVYPSLETANITIYKEAGNDKNYSPEVTDDGIIYKNVEMEDGAYLSLHYDGNTYGYANMPTAEQALSATQKEITAYSSATMPHYAFGIPLALNGTYSIKVSFSQDYTSAKIQLLGGEEVSYPDKLYLVGTMNNWTLPGDGSLVEIPAIADGVYSATIDIPAYYESNIGFKIFNTISSSWMDGTEYYGSKYPDNFKSIFDDAPVKWTLAPGYGSSDLTILNVTSLKDAVVTINLKENFVTISSASAPKAPTELFILDGGQSGDKVTLQPEGDTGIFKGTMTLAEGSHSLNIAGNNDYLLGTSMGSCYLWNDRQADIMLVSNSESPLMLGNWVGGQLEVSVNITNNRVAFAAPQQPSYPETIYIVMKDDKGTKFPIPSSVTDYGEIPFSGFIEDWQKDLKFDVEVPGIGILHTNSEPVELWQDEYKYVDLDVTYDNSIVVSNWDGGNLSVFVPDGFMYIRLSSFTQPIPKQTLYIIGSPQGWNIEDGSMELEQVGKNKFAGAFEMPAEPMFRFYTELGDWENGSLGSQWDDAPIGVNLVADEELTVDVAYGKGSWNFTGFPGGKMYMEVDLSNMSATFSTLPISGVELIRNDEMALKVVEGGIEVVAPQGMETIVYDFAGRIVGRGAGTCKISLAPGLYISNGQKIIVK